MTTESGSVVIKIAGDDSDFEGKLNGLGSKTKKAMKAVGAALIAAGGYAIKTGIDFESAFAGVKKTVDATDEQLATLRDGIREMAKEMPTSADEIAAVAEAAGQLVIQTDNILEFTEAMVMLGDSTNLSADEAATSLARLANITGMSQTDFDKLGSVIVALGNNLATTESEITEMGLRIAGAGAQVGMSEADIMSFSAALSSVGIEAEAGGSAFSTLISNMSLATQTGGEDLQQFADVAGMTADEFKTAFEQDASGAILSFIQGLGQLDANGGSAIATLDEMGLSDIRMRDALLRAAGASDTFTEALQLGSDAWEENTALANEAEQRYATVESKLSILKNNVDDLGISLYDSIRDPLAQVVDVANNTVSRLSDAFNAGGFGGLFAELGTVILQGVPQMISSGAELIRGLTDGIRTSLPNMIPAAMEALVSFSGSLRESAGQLVDAGLELITVLAQSLIDNLPVFIETIPTIITNIAGIINDNAPKLLATGVELIGMLAQGIIQAIPTLIANIPQILLAIVSVFSAYNWISLGQMIVNGIRSGVTMLGSALQTAGTNALNAFKSINWANAGTAVCNFIHNAIAGAGGLILSALRTVGTNGMNAFRSINWASVGRSAITFISNAAKGAGGLVKSALTSVGRSAMSAFKSINWSSLGSNIISGIVKGVSGAASRLVSSLQNLAKRALNAAKSALGIASPSKVMAREVGRWIPAGIAQGIDKNAGAVQDAMENAVDSSTLLKSVDLSTIQRKLEAAAQTQALRFSSEISSAPGGSVNPTSEGKTVVIYYQPEQKCDEPMTARQLDAVNRQNARRMERILKNA